VDMRKTVGKELLREVTVKIDLKRRYPEENYSRSIIG